MIENSPSLLPGDRVSLPPWVRLHFDKVRNRYVLLAPERVLFPCPISVEIAERIEAPKPFSTLVDELADLYEAPAEIIAKDVEKLLAGLSDQGFLEVRNG